MGFLDKAKKLADQAQEKLDEVQKQFNESQSQSGGSASGTPPVEYDQHGRPVAKDPEPPHGDPLTGSAPQPAPPADKGPTIQPEEEAPQERPQGDPLRDASTSPPKPPSGGSGMTGGDPLAG
jgi:hypothetical protein